MANVRLTVAPSSVRCSKVRRAARSRSSAAARSRRRRASISSASRDAASARAQSRARPAPEDLLPLVFLHRAGAAAPPPPRRTRRAGRAGYGRRALGRGHVVRGFTAPVKLSARGGRATQRLKNVAAAAIGVPISTRVGRSYKYRSPPAMTRYHSVACAFVRFAPQLVLAFVKTLASCFFSALSTAVRSCYSATL